MSPGVYITFDVECSMGGAWSSDRLSPVTPARAVWGEYGDRKLGLPLITDILGASGLAATFFVDAFMAEQGYVGAEEKICRFLIDRGHDVQLHVHPNHKHYAMKQRGKDFAFTDQMGELSPEVQLSILREGCRRIEQCTGRAPVAFRAGNMGASDETLAQMPKAGLLIDSSYTFPYVGGQCLLSDRQAYNGSKRYGEVVELALSGFCQSRLPGLHPAKPLDLVGISFEECRDATCRILAAGADVVLILHSFSLFKVRNKQYDAGRLNRIVTRRFRRMCEWLARHADDAPVRTFSELAGAIADGRYTPRAVEPCKLTRPCRAALRKIIQAVNNAYWV